MKGSKNMKKENHIARKDEAALKSIEGLEAAEVKPFFYTRLQAKMENEQALERSPFQLLGNLKVSLAMLAVVLLFNVTSLVFLTENQNTETTSTSALDAFSEEYFSTSNSYDYLNEY